MDTKELRRFQRRLEQDVSLLLGVVIVLAQMKLKAARTMAEELLGKEVGLPPEVAQELRRRLQKKTWPLGERSSLVVEGNRAPRAVRPPGWVEDHIAGTAP